MSLSDSIESHKKAAANVEAAARAVESAKAYIRQLEREIETFAGIEGQVAASRAESVKASMVNGGTPRFDISTELQQAVAKRTETEATLSAARQAAAALAGEHSVAAAVERDVKAHVEALAGAVVIDELAELAGRIKVLESEATTLRAKLHGAGYVWGAFHVTRAARVKLPALAVEVLTAQSPREQIEAHRSPAQQLSNSKAQRWREYIAELTTDASAIFEPDFMG